MKPEVFISFSGRRSHEVAIQMGKLLREVLPVEPWTSDKIGEGEIWAKSIHDALGKVAFGISCVTQENQVNPWILFEAGAIGKQRYPSRWALYLIDRGIKLAEPLGCYQSTPATRGPTKIIVQTIARTIKSPWTRETEKKFTTQWNRLERVLTSIRQQPGPVPRELPQLVLNTLEIEKTTPFRRWLRNRVLTTASLATREIAQWKLFDKDEFRRRVAHELASCAPGMCIAALCADKRLPDRATLNYFRRFYRWAEELDKKEKKAGILSPRLATTGPGRASMDRIRLCRIFVRPLKDIYGQVIDEHREHAKYGVWPLVISRAARSDLANQYPDIAARLKEGFGFVVFHTPTYTKVITHVSPGKEISASDFTERANVQEILMLFDDLFDYASGTRFCRTDPLWADFLSRLNPIKAGGTT